MPRKKVTDLRKIEGLARALARDPEWMAGSEKSLTDMQKIVRDWMKSRTDSGLMKLEGTAISVRPAIRALVLRESTATRQPVGAVVRDDLELARWLRVLAARGDRDAAAVLKRFLVEGPLSERDAATALIKPPSR